MEGGDIHPRSFLYVRGLTLNILRFFSFFFFIIIINEFMNLSKFFSPRHARSQLNLLLKLFRFPRQPP